MKRILIIIWNLCILGFISLAVFALYPKIRGQFTALDKLPLGLLRDWTEAFGYIGLGLLVGVAVSAIAVSSPFWGHISSVWRILLGLVYFIFVCGVVLVSNVELEFVGSVAYVDYLTFLGTVGLFVLPPVICGSGILYLAWSGITCLIKMKRSSKGSAEHTS